MNREGGADSDLDLHSGSLARLGWGLADQALSSLTNFAVGILIARSVGTREFGAFALAFATFIVLMGVTRGLVAEPLTIRYSALSEERWRGAVRRGTGVAVIVGVVGGAGCLVVALLTGGALRDAFLALAVCLPGLLLQDSWRFAFFALGRGRTAFLNDLTWAVLLVPGLLALNAANRVTVAGAVLVWGGAALVAGVVGILQSRAVPDLRASLGWIKEQRDIAPSLVGESLSSAGAQQLGLFGIGAVAGLAATGALRAGQLLLGPLQVLFLGVYLVAVPEAVRLLRAGRNLVRPALALSTVLSGIAVAAGLAVLALPSTVGELILGESWEPARAVVLPWSLAVAAGGMLAGAHIGLRALAETRRSLMTRAGIGIVVIASEVAGAAVGDAPGAAWGHAAAMWAGVGVWWYQFRLARNTAGM